MELFPGLRARLRALVSRSSADDELNEEIAYHIERETEKLVQMGSVPDEARRIALARFGGATQTREAHRSVRGMPWATDLVRDTRYAIRGLSRSRVFAAAAVVTLTLGIGATTAVVSVVRALLFHPTPVVNQDRLKVVWQWAPCCYTPSTSMAQGTYSFGHYRNFRDATTDVFDGVGAYAYGSVALRDGAGARPLSASFTTGSYFPVLRLTPALGRFYGSEQDVEGGAGPEVVISYDFWQREYRGDSSVLGRIVYADSRAFDVVGVAPRGFTGTISGLAADIWIPATVSGSTGALTIFGRLKDGLSVQRAEAMLALSAPPPAILASTSKSPWRTRLDPMDGVPEMARTPLTASMGLLLVTAGFVLLLAATNVAGMLLARATARRREVAIRLAIGASRARLVRQFVQESLLLSLAGAAGGVLLARWLMSLANSIDIPIGPRVQFGARVDGVVMVIAIAIAVLAGVLAGLTPALQATRFDLVHALRDGESGGSGRPGRMRSTLVTSQVALSLALLIAAGLFTKALVRALSTDAGVDGSNVAMARIQTGPHGYSDARSRAFYDELVTRLGRRAEVASVGLGSWTPLSGSFNGVGVLYPGDTDPHGRRLPVAFGVVDTGYLATLRVPLLEGRKFTNGDDETSPLVVVVNDVLARKFWPGESAIDKLLYLDGPNKRPRRIVGVALGGKIRSLSEAPNAYAYIPLGQRRQSSLIVFVRGRTSASSALSVLREVVGEIDPNIALESAGAFDSLIAVYVLPQRAAALVIGILGLMGLALASIGIYGLVAYVVAQRTREFGIRIALGARGREVVALAQRRTLKLLGGGALVGLLLGLGIGRLAASLLFGVSATDPLVIAAALAFLALAGFVASWIPARRAARVDPMEALRAE